MADFKGGRGKKTGYQTEMYRIPSPVRPVIEKLGMQFRLLWDGVSDPKGEKLISRIEIAIPDCEQPLIDKLISSKEEVSISDIKYEDEEDTKEVEPDEPDTTDEQTIRDQADKNFKLLTENRMLDRELSEVRSQLASCKTLEKDATEQLALEMSNGFKAADILKEALKLKAGNGGAIKVKIKEALQLIDDI